MPRMVTTNLREHIVRTREEIILDAVTRLLAERGYERTTVEAVAHEVGVAKASLYKHFASKEALVLAALLRLLRRALAHLEQIDRQEVPEPLDRLKAVVRWCLDLQFAGEMPVLPTHDPAWRQAMRQSPTVTTALVQVTDKLGAWIIEAQAAGQVDLELPPEVVLYTLLARANDPVLALLHAAGQHSREQIAAWLLRTCFAGLGGQGVDGLPVLDL